MCEYYSLDKVVFGDIEGDGRDEAAVLQTHAGAVGSSVYSFSNVFALVDGCVAVIPRRAGLGIADATLTDTVIKKGDLVETFELLEPGQKSTQGVRVHWGIENGVLVEDKAKRETFRVRAKARR